MNKSNVMEIDIGAYASARIDSLLEMACDEIKPINILSLAAHMKKKHNLTVTHDRVRKFLHAKGEQYQLCSMSLAGFSVPQSRLLSERWWKTRHRMSDSANNVSV